MPWHRGVPVKSSAADFYRTMCSLTQSILYTRASGESMDLPSGVSVGAELIHERTQAGCKLMFIGNGGFGGHILPHGHGFLEDRGHAGLGLQ